MSIKEMIKEMVVNNVELLIKSDKLRVTRMESFVVIGLYIIQKTDNVKWVNPSRLFKVIESRCKTSKIYFYELLRKLESQNIIIKKKRRKGFNITLNTENSDINAFIINSGITYLSEVEE